MYCHLFYGSQCISVVISILFLTKYLFCAVNAVRHHIGIWILLGLINWCTSEADAYRKSVPQQEVILMKKNETNSSLIL